jgi:hypothetical protein
MDLRFRHQAVWRRHTARPLLLFKKSVADHNWFALPERTVMMYVHICSAGIIGDVMSKSVMRNVARFRTRGHGLRCETGIIHQESGQVCMCLQFMYVKTGISKMRSTINFHVRAPNIYGTGLTILIIFLQKFCFQHNSEVYKFSFQYI